jgi:hypothetical protein
VERADWHGPTGRPSRPCRATRRACGRPPRDLRRAHARRPVGRVHRGRVGGHGRAGERGGRRAVRPQGPPRPHTHGHAAWQRSRQRHARRTAAAHPPPARAQRRRRRSRDPARVVRQVRLDRPVAEHILAGMLAGLSTRRCDQTVEPWPTGSTENAAVCTRLVADLAARGLSAEHGCCSSSMAARHWTRPSAAFGAEALSQRCRRHKQRNVLDHLPSTSGR